MPYRATKKPQVSTTCGFFFGKNLEQDFFVNLSHFEYARQHSQEGVMGRYKRKDGTVVITEAVDNEAMNKRGISKLIHVIPPHPKFKSQAAAKMVASFLGPEFLDAVSTAQKAKKNTSGKD